MSSEWLGIMALFFFLIAPVIGLAWCIWIIVKSFIGGEPKAQKGEE